MHIFCVLLRFAVLWHRKFPTGLSRLVFALEKYSIPRKLFYGTVARGFVVTIFLILSNRCDELINILQGNYNRGYITMPFRVASLALEQSYGCPCTSRATLVVRRGRDVLVRGRGDFHFCPPSSIVSLPPPPSQARPGPSCVLFPVLTSITGLLWNVTNYSDTMWLVQDLLHRNSTGLAWVPFYHSRF